MLILILDALFGIANKIERLFLSIQVSWCELDSKKSKKIRNRAQKFILRRDYMPLAIAPMGVSLRVIKILLDEKLKKHLSDLGITINSTINVLESSGGNLICVVKDGRLALDTSITTKIFVA